MKEPITIKIAPHEVFAVLQAIGYGAESGRLDKEQAAAAGWFHQRLLTEFARVTESKGKEPA